MSLKTQTSLNENKKTFSMRYELTLDLSGKRGSLPVNIEPVWFIVSFLNSQYKLV